MNILAIESSAKTLNVAIKTETTYCSTLDFSLGMTSETIMPRILDLCSRANIGLNQIEIVACSRGPGSFTSLRVGMATAKGIATALSIPLVSIDTLELYHYPVRQIEMVKAVVVDARKQRFYCALFDRNGRLTEDLDATCEEFVRYMCDYARVFVTGPDVQLFKTSIDASETLSKQPVEVIIDELTHRDYGESLAIMALAKFRTEGPDHIGSGPTYIRKSDAELVRLSSASTRQ